MFCVQEQLHPLHVFKVVTPFETDFVMIYGLVKGMNLFCSRDNSLIGGINNEGSLEVFQKVSSGSAVKLVEIGNIKEQNMVALNEAALSHSRALSQSRDQGRSIE